MPRFASAIALGVLLGWTAAHFLSLQWWTVVPWGLAAVSLGYRAGRPPAGVGGALYGFVPCFVFTPATYGGGGPPAHPGTVFYTFGLRGGCWGVVACALGRCPLPG